MGDSNRKNALCRLRALFAEKTVKNTFPFVLCLLDSSAPDVTDPMWVEGMWAGNMSVCRLAPDWN